MRYARVLAARAAVAIGVLAGDLRAQSTPLPLPPPPPPSDSPTPQPLPVARPRGAPPPRVSPPPPAPVTRPAAPPASPAPQPSEPAPEAPDDDLTLGGYSFIVPAFQDSAFVITSLSARQGVASKSVPNVPFGSLGLIDLRSFGVLQSTTFSLKILDWLGASAGVGGYQQLGTNVRSLIAAGGEYSYGGNLGLTLRVLRMEKTKTQVSVQLHGGLTAGKITGSTALLAALAQSPAPSVEDVVASDLGNLLVMPVTTAAFRGSVNVAQALSKYVGAQASLGLAYTGTTIERRDATGQTTTDAKYGALTPTLGVALSGDLTPKNVPLVGILEVGVAVPFLRDHQAQTSTTRVQPTVALGAYYVGRRDLQLGVIGSALFGLEPVSGFDTSRNAAPSDGASIVMGELIVRYIW